MKTKQEHRETLKEIAYYAFSYGLNNSGIDLSNIKMEDILNVKTLFVQKVHEGFKIAQNLLIVELLGYQKFLKDLKSDLAQSRRERNKDKVEKLLFIKKNAEYRISTFTHIADAIAWQILGGQIHLSRRLYIGDKDLKSLDNSNLEHAISTSNKFNEDPNTFALISDLTRFVQIGDLLIKKENGVEVVELKEGKVNKKIFEFLDDLDEKNMSIDDIDLEGEFDKTTAKQVRRVNRQKKRMEKAEEVMNNDEGIDHITNKKIITPTPKGKTVYFLDILVQMSNTLKEKKFDYKLLEGCLHIGMYKEEFKDISLFMLEQLVKKETNNYIIIDWMSISSNLSQPLFSKPLNPDFIIDVLTGEVKVIMALDFDKLIEVFNLNSLESKWLTKKETARMKTSGDWGKFFEINKRGIFLKMSEVHEGVLHGGIISKILYDNIRPSSIAQTIISGLAQYSEEEE